MIIILFTIQLFAFSYGLQTGYTCESIVKLTCPQTHKLIILEVTYSTACTNQTSNYAPSRCIARHREPISTKCNGYETCSIENIRENNPSFNIDLESNCHFQGQSINIEYSCIPELKSNELPTIDICSLKSIENIREGLIYSPNYPKDYGMNLNCSKTISVVEIAHRLKIYAIHLNMKSIISLQSTGPKRFDDWLEINDNGEKITSSGRKSYSLLYEDIIDANLRFQTESIRSKQDIIGFLLYFIVTPIRRSRPAVKSTTTDVALKPEKSALIIEKQDKQTNIIFIILLTGILLISIIGFLIYKRGNDRRIRYLEQAFQSYIPKTSKIEEFSSLSSEKSEHIYSDDPLIKSNNDSANLYEPIDDYDSIKSKQITV